MIFQKKKGKPIVKCNECGRLINVKPKTKRKEDIEYKYMTCKRCGALYVISAADEALRQDIKRFEEMTAGQNRRLTEEEEQKAQALLRANVARSRQLKEMYPLTLKPWQK